ncbi:testis-specific serine/threonine-protein kinase 1-like, partial [Rhopilema esculentum]|eukprot:gene8865-16481_t
MEEVAENVKLVLKGNKWLKQKESPFVTLAQEGIRAEELLGEGAFAKVVSAYHEKLKRKVAVKITDKRKAPAEYLEKFLQREINAICELDHPNIVKLLGIYESTDRIFMVMELCEGGDLLDFVNEQKYRSEMEVKRHFQELSLAIYHTHQRGVVHRDLKLENLILDFQGNLKVT